ncbi:phage distal tail protein [Amycolatopsis speibonae]|uniref:Phage tail domain-containing protein n=1 Tax=Amycolatopsis speibonae TaxID=1450224 RepID=A0ABV7P7B2_9PSEU
MTAEITRWIDPNGVETLLDVDWEATGRFMPEPQHDEDEVPEQDGSHHRETRFKPKDFTIRVTTVENGEPALRQSLRDLMKAMNPKKGEGIIRVTSPIGDTREIGCRYLSGLGLEEKPEVSGPTMQQAVITLHANDPFWLDQSDTTTTYAIGNPPAFFPIPPLRLTASEIAVDTTVNNDGDDDAWPVWTIYGPGSGATLRNLTTGKVLSLPSSSLGLGESISIDTRKGRKTVTKNDGTNLFTGLTTTSALWPLVEGTNAVRLEMTGVTTGVSSLQLSYRRRYLSP